MLTHGSKMTHLPQRRTLILLSCIYYIVLKSEAGHKKALLEVNMKEQHLDIKIKTTTATMTNGGLLYIILQINLR